MNIQIHVPKPVEHSKDSVKRKFIAVSKHIRKLEISQVNNLMMYPKCLVRHEQITSQKKLQNSFNELN
jgi:hypothetical protein